METYKVIYNLRNPLAVPEENKPINANILVMSYAQPLNQAFLVAQRTQRRHEPAVSIPPLSHVVSRRAFDVKLRLVENLHDTLGAARSEILAGVVEGLKVGERFQAVSTTELQIGLEVKMRIPVFFVDTAAFLDNLLDFGSAHSRCRFVGSLGCGR